MRNAAGTRERLIAAARKAFSERGFERTTVREIAAEASANPSLINRYFGGKEQLFAASVSIDLDFPDLRAVPKESVGRTLIRHFFERWEGEEHDDLLRVLIRTAVANDEAAERVRSILAGQVTSMVAQIASPERAEERAALIATQILGLAYARHVLSLSDEIISPKVTEVMLGATIQKYLFDDLP